jgi:signal transduction histidine kinase
MRRFLADTALAVVLTLAGVQGTIAAAAGSAPQPHRPLDALGVALVIGVGSMISVRRVWPEAALIASTLMTTAYLLLNYTYGPVFFLFMIPSYTVARYLQPRRAIPVASAAVAVMVTHVFFADSPLGIFGLIPAMGWVVVPFALGLIVRTVKETRQRQRAETIRRHVDDERLRVAQEVHDIVGHGLAAIKMQADVALHVLPRKPEQASIALEAISRTSGVALEELRMTLATVRAPALTLGLERLPELAERMREAGLRVETMIEGDRPELPAAVDLSAYRVVQESLTNVLRHSGATQASVTVAYTAADVTISVANALTGPAAKGEGSGIAGMRHRAEALGGELRAGPVSSDRFEVTARLPLGGAG